MSRIHYDLYARDSVLKLGHETKIMGIVNCTPDSFSGDGKMKNGQGVSACLKYAQQLILDGADILDVGGESTRPGATSVTAAEEIDRIIPVIKILARKSIIPVSVDTSKQQVAQAALDAGATIINNIRGTHMSRSFMKMVRDYGASIVIMHMRGTPATMQSKTRYKNLLKEIIKELQISVEKCREIGIKKDRIIVDPGIGFAKTVDQNLILINHLDDLNVLGCPILLGTSRKSFIGHLLQDNAANRLMGTAATVSAGVLRGAHMVRVHDVRAIKETLKVTDAILNA